MNSLPRKADQLFVAPAVELDVRSDGSQLFRSELELPDSYSRCVGEWLEHWAEVDPDRPFLAERGADGEWILLNYGEALKRVYCIAAKLLDQNLSADHPVVILSGNSIEHALLMLAAMHVGVPSCTISPGNSLLSKDFAKLKDNIALLTPGLIYADPIAHFMPAINAVSELHGGLVVAGSRSEPTPGTTPFSEFEAGKGNTAVAKAYSMISGDTIGKFLFTSGSVGAAKAVINTQRMMCSNQAAKEMIWPFLRNNPPVLLDWLPWSHTFGGNHNFNMVLRWGGTLYLDDGKPTPSELHKTIRNLKEVSPTIYLSVPRAYDMLVPHLRNDLQLREGFFRQLQLIYYAGAALPQHLWNELENLSRMSIGTEVAMCSSWGSSETAPMATDCHFQAIRSGVIGVPIPGTTLKLVPSSDKLEARVGGPNVFPGYWKQPALSAAAFDEEGYYRTGDAVKFVDLDRPELGLLFDGRTAEDFKALSGTWVHVGALRLAGIDAFSPIVEDIVVTGHDREEIGFLVFPSIPECRALCSDLPPDASVEQLVSSPAVVQHIRRGMAKMAKSGGSSTYPNRVMLMQQPPSVEAGEITEKGYINQQMVRTRRADLVELLYFEGNDNSVITLAAALGK